MDFIIKKDMNIEIDDGEPMVSFLLSDTTSFSQDLNEFMAAPTEIVGEKNIKIECVLSRIVDQDIRDRKVLCDNNRYKIPERLRPRYGSIREALLVAIDKIDDIEYQLESV